MTTRTAATIRQLAAPQADNARRAFSIRPLDETFAKRLEYRYPLSQRTDLRKAKTVRPHDWDSEE